MGLSVPSQSALLFSNPCSKDANLQEAQNTLADSHLGYAAAFFGKKVTAFSSYIASSVSTGASFLRPINDQIMPHTLTLLKIARESATDKTVRQTFLSSMEVVKMSDLFETVNDINYFFNGDFVKAYAKGRYFEIAAQVFLIPTNLLGIVLYGRNINPGFMSFLGKWATGVGRLPYASVVGRFAALPACYSTLSVAYAGFAADSIQRGLKYHHRIRKLEASKDLTLPYQIKARKIDKQVIVPVKFKEEKDKAAKIQHLKAKLTNAKWSCIVNSTKLAITIVALGALLNVSVLVTVSTSPLAMLGMGALVLYGVGRGIYLKMQGLPAKPTIAYEPEVKPKTTK